MSNLPRKDSSEVRVEASSTPLMDTGSSMVEQSAYNRPVAGSSPAPCTTPHAKLEQEALALCHTHRAGLAVIQADSKPECVMCAVFGETHAKLVTPGRVEGPKLSVEIQEGYEPADAPVCICPLRGCEAHRPTTPPVAQTAVCASCGANNGGHRYGCAANTYQSTKQTAGVGHCDGCEGRVLDKLSDTPDGVVSDYKDCPGIEVKR